MSALAFHSSVTESMFLQTCSLPVVPAKLLVSAVEPRNANAYFSLQSSRVRRPSDICQMRDLGTSAPDLSFVRHKINLCAYICTRTLPS